jgi:hypothetical protein
MAIITAHSIVIHVLGDDCRWLPFEVTGITGRIQQGKPTDMRTFNHTTGAVLHLILLHPVQLCAQAQVKQYYTTTDKRKPGSNHPEWVGHALERESMDAFWSHIQNARIKCPCQHKTHFHKGFELVKSNKLSPPECQLSPVRGLAMEDGNNLDTILCSIVQVYALEKWYGGFPII